MAEKDAKVRLNLAASGFLTQLQGLRKASEEFEKAVEGIGDGAEKANRKLGTLGQAGKAALGGMRSSLAELGQGLKTAVVGVATLGGALSAAAAAKGGMDLVKSYKDIANSISAGTGAAMTWQEVQVSIEGTAKRWKRGNAEMAESYKSLWDDIGDAKFAAAGIESVGRAATAGYGSVGALTSIVGTLKEKFDIPTEGIDDALASVIAMGNKGGAGVEDLGAKMGILGATAKEAGLEGADGLKKILSMLNFADTSTGNFRKSLKAVSGVFETMADPEKLKAISKELKLSLVDSTTKKPFKDALERVLLKSGGKQEILAKLFSGEEQKLMIDLGKTYAKAFSETKGDVLTKSKAGLAAYNDALSQAGKQTLTAADADKAAKERLMDQDRQMADAMRRLEIAFTKPEMVEGLTKLAEVAPKVADALAKLLGWAVDHPKTAAAAVVGGVAAKGALGAGLGVALPAIGKAILKRVAGGAAASAVAGEGAAVVGTAGAGGTAAGGAGLAAVAAPAAAVAAAGAVGFYAGYKIVEATDASKKRTQLSLSDATWDAKAARLGGNDEQKHAAATALRKEISVSRRGSIGGLLGDLGVGNKETRQKASKELDLLEKSFSKGSSTGERLASSLSRVADSAEKMDRVFSKFGGSPDGTNGMSPAPSSWPGSGTP